MESHKSKVSALINTCNKLAQKDVALPSKEFMNFTKKAQSIFDLEDQEEVKDDN